jgi:hypothetical protein
MGQQHRKNPLPAVREAQGNGIYLLAHGEPHDPCPVAGCGGTLLSCTGEGNRIWAAVCSHTNTADRRPGAKMTPGGGSARSRAHIQAR